MFPKISQTNTSKPPPNDFCVKNPNHPAVDWQVLCHESVFDELSVLKECDAPRFANESIVEF